MNLFSSDERKRMEALAVNLGTLGYGLLGNNKGLEAPELRDWRRRFEMEGRGFRSAFSFTKSTVVYIRRNGLLVTLDRRQSEDRVWGRWNLNIILPPQLPTLPAEKGWATVVKDVAGLEGKWWDDLRREMPQLEAAAVEYTAIEKERFRRREEARIRAEQEAREQLLRKYREGYG